MTDELTMRFTRRTLHIVLAKAFVVLVAGVGLGLSMTADDRANQDRATSLTLEQYTSEFEQYKAELTADVLSPTVNMIGALVVLLGAFLVYEGLGYGFAWLVGRLTSSAPRPGPGAA